MNFSWIIYLIQLQPYSDKRDLRYELMNEFMVSIISLFFLALYYYPKESVATNISIGWAIVILTLLVFIMNYVFILFIIVEAIVYKLKMMKYLKDKDRVHKFKSKKKKIS